MPDQMKHMTTAREKLVEEMAKKGFLEYSDKVTLDEYDWCLAFPHTLKFNGKVSEKELFTRIAKGMLSVVLSAIERGEVVGVCDSCDGIGEHEAIDRGQPTEYMICLECHGTGITLKDGFKEGV
jgi:hypothetical protein